MANMKKRFATFFLFSIPWFSLMTPACFGDGVVELRQVIGGHTALYIQGWQYRDECWIRRVSTHRVEIELHVKDYRGDHDVVRRRFNLDDFEYISFYGLSGNDYLVNMTLARVRAEGGAGHDRLILGDGGGSAYGGFGNDVLVGGERRDRLYGEDGNDILFGHGGNDDLFGGHKNTFWEERHGDQDHLYGGDGFDFLHGCSGDDHLFGGAASDTLLGGRGNDYLHAGTGEDEWEIEGQEGSDIFAVPATAVWGLFYIPVQREVEYVDYHRHTDTIEPFLVRDSQHLLPPLPWPRY